MARTKRTTSSAAPTSPKEPKKMVPGRNGSGMGATLGRRKDERTASAARDPARPRLAIADLPGGVRRATTENPLAFITLLETASDCGTVLDCHFVLGYDHYSYVLLPPLMHS